MNDVKTEKTEGINWQLLEDVNKMRLDDVIGVAKIYTKYKRTSSYKVVSLETGGYAVINENNDIIFKNDNIHLCKVEWIMLHIVKDYHLDLSKSEKD